MKVYRQPQDPAMIRYFLIGNTTTNSRYLLVYLVLLLYEQIEDINRKC